MLEQPLRQDNLLSLKEKLSSKPPLPPGEGWGEGNQKVTISSLRLVTDMIGGRVRAIFARYASQSSGRARAVFHGGLSLAPADGKTAYTGGLTARAAGALRVPGLKRDRSKTKNACLVMGYEGGKR